MTPADTTPDSSGTPAPAAGELLIPKARLDEVLAENRRLKESETIKDQLYLQERQRNMPTQQAPEMTAEEVGLDPQTFQAVMKVAAKMAEKIIAPERANLSQQIGILANRTEQASLLATKGAGKAKYLPEIERMQRDHASRTGTFLPADIALNILESSEKDEKIRQLEAKLAGVAPAAASVNPPPSAGPSAAGTRQLPTGGVSAPVAAAGKSFSDLSVDEMEARLEEQFKSGALA